VQRKIAREPEGDTLGLTTQYTREEDTPAVMKGTKTSLRQSRKRNTTHRRKQRGCKTTTLPSPQ
jgi:hypothetical protein